MSQATLSEEVREAIATFLWDIYPLWQAFPNMDFVRVVERTNGNQISHAMQLKRLHQTNAEFEKSVKDIVLTRLLYPRRAYRRLQLRGSSMVRVCW